MISVNVIFIFFSFERLARDRDRSSHVLSLFLSPGANEIKGSIVPVHGPEFLKSSWPEAIRRP